MSSSTVINFEERKKRKRNHVGDSSSGAITNLSDDSAAITTNASVSSKNIDGVFNENSSSREDNPMIEIFHLHNCFRNAIQDLQDDCAELERLYDSKFVCDEKGYSCCDSEDKDLSEVRELEGTIAGRFQVIWSVFAAHSKAEGMIYALYDIFVRLVDCASLCVLSVAYLFVLCISMSKMNLFGRLSKRSLQSKERQVKLPHMMLTRRCLPVAQL